MQCLDELGLDLIGGQTPFGPRKGGGKRASAPHTSTDPLDDINRLAALSSVNAQTVVDVKAAVMALPKAYWGGERGPWLSVAMALKSLAHAGYENDARMIWHDFSAKDPGQYSHAEAEKIFDTAHPHAITYRSIFHWAHAEGVTAITTPETHALGVAFPLDGPAQVPLRQWLYNGHYVRKFVSTTVSPGGIGKSILAMTEAVAIATGLPLLGVEPTERGPVWYFNAEDPMEEIRRRLAAICAHHGVTNERIGGRLFLGSGRDVDLIIATQDKSGAKLTETSGVVKDFITSRGVILAILDPFVSTHRVSENDNNAIDLVVKQWNKIAEATNCAVELVHHTRKGGGQNETTVEDGRGASALLSAARSARVLNRMTEQEAKKLGVDNRFAFFYVTNGKANFVPATDRREWYRFVSFDMGNSDGIRPSDKVGVITPWVAPDVQPSDELSDEIRDLILDELAASKVGQRCDVRSSNWFGMLVARVAGLNIGEKGVKNRIMMKINEWESVGIIVKKITKDEKRMPREVYERCFATVRPS